MTISKQKFEEIKKKYSLTIVSDYDVGGALMFVHDLLLAEADEIKKTAPYATRTINRCEEAAYLIYSLSSDVENDIFEDQ